MNRKKNKKIKSKIKKCFTITKKNFKKKLGQFTFYT